MRELVVALVCGAAALAHADKPKPIDAKAVADKLDFYRDEVGNLYVVPKADAFSFDEAQQWVFYGDNKTLYQQRIFSASQQQGRQYEFGMWAPRAKGMTGATIEYAADKYQLRCRHTKEGVRVLTQLTADEAHTVLTHATFLPPLWQRQAHLLARDDDAVYYYVDELRDDAGGNGFRVFVGAKGAMKELAMTNVATDSGGEIFATKTGQLKIVKGDNGKGYWIKSGKKTELTMLEPADNRYLIYRDLGIYGPLGAVCDDL